MKAGLLIYGSLDTISGGYLYDRKLVEYLKLQGDTVEVISLPWRNYLSHLMDNLTYHLPAELDVLIQDELNHPSLIFANQGQRTFPVVSLVHHLRSSEAHPYLLKPVYRRIERAYLSSVDAFIFNSETTRKVVLAQINHEPPNIVAYPPSDRFGSPIGPDLVKVRSAEVGSLRILFLGNVIRRKGLHLLIEAIGRNPQGYQLEVVGSLDMDPEYVNKVKYKTSVYGMGERVRFYGTLSRRELIRILHRFNLLLEVTTNPA